jgi:hypothetical protein
MPSNAEKNWNFSEIRLPLPSVYIGTIVDETSDYSFPDNSAAARFLMESALQDLDGKAITESTPENDEVLSDMMVSEALFALNREDVVTSCNWYTDAIDRMVVIASTIHPEIGSDDEASRHPSNLFKNRNEARTVLFAAMAITSQNINVQDNMKYALEQYRHFLTTGNFKPKGYGANGAAIESNLARFNFILSRAGGDLTRLRKLLTMKLTMSQLQKIGRKHGIEIGGRVLADEIVYGSMLFGPKVGNGFFQNLMGNHEPVTVDLWFMRMWGRYTGTLIRDEISGDAHERLLKGMKKSMESVRMKGLLEKEGLARTSREIDEMDAPALLDYCRKLKLGWEKIRRRYVEGKISNSYATLSVPRKERPSNVEASEFKSKLGWPGAADSIVGSLGMPVDMPKNGTMRRWIGNVVTKSIQKLKNYGYEMSAADLQAILWYPEKEIYGKLTGRTIERFNMSYDEAILKIAISEGIKEEIIETALITMGKADELKFDIRKFMQSKLGNVNIGYSAEVSLNPIDNETEEVDMVFSI